MALVAAKANVVAKKEVRTSFLFCVGPGGGGAVRPYRRTKPELVLALSWG